MPMMDLAGRRKVEHLPLHPTPERSQGEAEHDTCNASGGSRAGEAPGRCGGKDPGVVGGAGCGRAGSVRGEAGRPARWKITATLVGVGVVMWHERGSVRS